MNKQIFLFLTGLLLNGVSAQSNLLRVADLSLLEGAITSITEGIAQDQTASSRSVVTSQNPGIEQSSFQVITKEPQAIQAADVIEDYHPDHHSHGKHRDYDHRSGDEEEYGRSNSRWDGGYNGRRPRYSGKYLNRRGEEPIGYQTTNYKGDKPTVNHDTYKSTHATYQPKVETGYKSHSKYHSEPSYGGDKPHHPHHHYQSHVKGGDYKSDYQPQSNYQSHQIKSDYPSYNTKVTPVYETGKAVYTTVKKDGSPVPIYDSHHIKYESHSSRDYPTTQQVPAYPSSSTDNVVSILPVGTNYQGYPSTTPPQTTTSYSDDKPKTSYQLNPTIKEVKY